MKANEMNKMSPRSRTRALRLGTIIAVACLVRASSAAVGGETLLMPERDMLMGTSEVVWGISTNDTAAPGVCTLDYGDLSPVQDCTGADKSYIAFNHTYASAGVKTITLDVDGDTANVDVTVHDPAGLTAGELRGVNVNRAIQNGLRHLWYSQENRADFDTSPFASWDSGFRGSNAMTALVVLAFENHGFLLPNSDADPSGLYQKYVVQRGLNFIGSTLRQVTLTVQQPGDRDPCVGTIVDPCIGLYNPDEAGYSTAVDLLPFAASNASTRHLPVVIGGEDTNGNGVLDNEDTNADGNLDVVEDFDGDGVFDLYYDCDLDYDYRNEDNDGDGNLDVDEDLNDNGLRDMDEPDVDGDGYLDPDNEDTDGDGVLDRAYQDCDGDGDFSHEDQDFDGVQDTVNEDTNGNGQLDNEDANGNGVLDPGLAGQTIGDVLQRLVNAIAWGQNDATEPVDNTGRGGWIYQFTDSEDTGGGYGGYDGVGIADNPGVNPPPQSSDGSTVGWDILANLDADATGATIPAFVMPEFRDYALVHGLNDDGSFDYQADANPLSGYAVNPAKSGIGLQGMFWTERDILDTQVQANIAYITARWNVPNGSDFYCSNGTFNKGCGYAMFNIFKALKLYGVDTLPIGDPDGPGPLSDGDWHGDFEDYLVANQMSPTSQTGGQWDYPGMGFSCCHSSTAGITSLGLLVLAPVALILPDPAFFGEFGLTHGDPPTTGPDTNPARTAHEVTATAMSFPATPGNESSRSPVPGATVDFLVISGPNTGKAGTDTTDINGVATFTYTDDKTTKPCDANGDGSITAADLTLIRAGYGPAAPASTATDRIRGAIGTTESNTLEKHWTVPDPRDGNRSGAINIADVRFCQLRQGT